MHGVQVVELVKVGEEEVIAMTNFCPDPSVISKDMKMFCGIEQAADVLSVILEFWPLVWKV